MANPNNTPNRNQAQWQPCSVVRASRRAAAADTADSCTGADATETEIERLERRELHKKMFGDDDSDLSDDGGGGGGGNGGGGGATGEVVATEEVVVTLPFCGRHTESVS